MTHGSFLLTFAKRNRIPSNLSSPSTITQPKLPPRTQACFPGPGARESRKSILRKKGKISFALRILVIALSCFNVSRARERRRDPQDAPLGIPQGEDEAARPGARAGIPLERARHRPPSPSTRHVCANEFWILNARSLKGEGKGSRGRPDEPASRATSVSFPAIRALL